MMVRFINNAKTAMLLALIMVLFAWCGQFFGGPRGMIMGLMFGGLMNIIAYLYSDKIALMSMRARPVQRHEAPQLYRIVEDLASRAGIPMPRIYICPQAAPNAFATGRNPSNSVVAVTQGLLQLCDERELSGVLAHEIAHIKHRDMLIQTIAATVAGAISALAWFGQWALIFGGAGGRDDRRGGGLGLLLMIIVAPLAAALIHMAISRSREYNADSLGGELCGNPLYLAGALGKLAGYNRRIPMEVNPAQSHLFIVQPLTGGAGLASLFSTHPPIEKRIALLERQAHEMGL